MTTAIVERSITAFLDGDDSLEISNIIHSTAGAARFGYSGPLVGGTTVYSWSAAALVEALGDAWLDEGWVEFQLRKPVYPSEVITTRVISSPPAERGERSRRDRGGPPAIEFTMTKDNGEVAVRGTAGLGTADFSSEITSAADRTPVPQPEERPFITRALAPLGEDLPAMAIDLSHVDAETYADEKASDSDPRWRGAGGRVHPGWIAQRANALLAHTWRYTAIHASSQIQHLAPVHPDQRLLVSGRLASGYERKGHEYAVIDLTITSEDGRDLVRMRQPTIYQVAAR
ncbi:MAG: hypothetical protein F4Z51_05390 [Chloroflexi bacterium]|nr:hypothetical protein [Chloroflexota bacterium]MYD17795.1 hypothetical protein [Chloroflexota bacterium]MYJ01076.1 hypothetical protein [Chloroflexota bacterium]